MNVVLKNVKHMPSMSEETECFTADVWYNGKKIAYAKNQGHGGSTYYHSEIGMRDLLAEAEAEAKKLPPTEYEGHVFESDLESVIDDLLTEYLKNQDFKKSTRKGILYETPSGERYIYSWKGYTIPKLLKMANGIKSIKKAITTLKNEGNTILNTNLGHLMD